MIVSDAWKVNVRNVCLSCIKTFHSHFLDLIYRSVFSFIFSSLITNITHTKHIKHITNKTLLYSEMITVIIMVWCTCLLYMYISKQIYLWLKHLTVWPWYCLIQAILHHKITFTQYCLKWTNDILLNNVIPCPKNLFVHKIDDPYKRSNALKYPNKHIRKQEIMDWRTKCCFWS